MVERETQEVHSGGSPDQHGSVMTPIYATSTFEYETPAELQGDYRYGRMGNPTRAALEQAIADLEGGTHAAAFASGMAAIDSVFATLTPGDHVVAGKNLYAETQDLLSDVYSEYGIETTQVDITDTAAINDAIDPNTELVYLETPTNPVLNVADIEAAAAAAHDHDAILTVDNTFASPVLQQPLDLGADIVVESLTKYLGGHSDVIAGAVTTRDAALADRIEYQQYTRGAIPGPFECFLVLRGIKTLSARMERHCRNARAIAEWLNDHPHVDRVYYPGLASHPNHDVAAAQMADYGGMVSFELDGGVDEATKFLANLDVITLAESLGGVESLVEVPAVMTHQHLDPDVLDEAGISQSLVRISAGVEHHSDLLGDLERAMNATYG